MYPYVETNKKEKKLKEMFIYSIEVLQIHKILLKKNLIKITDHTVFHLLCNTAY